MDIKPLQPVQSVTDFDAIRDLNVPRNKITPDILHKVSKQFESLFLQEMLKSMRKANKGFESSLTHSDSGDFYQEMYDKQIALNMANGNGLGLADVIYRQLSQQVVKK